MKKENGITLIALIITIIIMLILVGVTINFALNGGIINKAKQAAAQSQLQADREALFSAVIGSIGLDGKVDFATLNTEAAKVGFTGSNGTYTSAAGNVFTVDEDGNIVSEGEGSNSDADLAYLKRFIGSTIGEMVDEDTSGILFKDPNIMGDVVAMNEMGSVGSPSQIEYPIIYKGRAYAFVINLENGDWEEGEITNVIERNTENTNADLVYVRNALVGKYVSTFATVDMQTYAITFNDSSITTDEDYIAPIESEDYGLVVHIRYKGSTYSALLYPMGEGVESILCYSVIEGKYTPETPTATD